MGIYGIQRHFQQYFSYIVAVNFIGDVNWKDLQSSTDGDWAVTAENQNKDGLKWLYTEKVQGWGGNISIEQKCT